MYDVCVIGAGASGVIAGIAAAKRGKKVLILDKNKKICRKIYSTGNGKCNMTNENFSIAANYNSESVDYPLFLDKILGKNPKDSVVKLFKEFGIILYNDNSYYYPKSNQASSVVWALQDQINKLKIDVKTKTSVNNIHKLEDKYEIKCLDNKSYYSRKIIIACGGASYSAIGGCFDGYNIAKNIGHKINTVSPALCGVHTKQNTEEISGVRVKSIAKIRVNENTLPVQFNHLEENGELQITADGLSGIMIFNLSSRMNQLLDKKIPFYLEIDLIPNINFNEYRSLWKLSEDRSIMGFINSLINDKLALYITKILQINPKENLNNLDSKSMLSIYDTLKHLRFDITKLKDLDNGQVCHGGVNIEEINPDTMASIYDNNIYIVGEMLDIDGVCGGYNLTFAFLSGLKAGMNV